MKISLKIKTINFGKLKNNLFSVIDISILIYKYTYIYLNIHNTLVNYCLMFALLVEIFLNTRIFQNYGRKSQHCSKLIFPESTTNRTSRETRETKFVLVSSRWIFISVSKNIIFWKSRLVSSRKSRKSPNLALQK